MILSALQAAIAPYKLYVYGIAAVILIGLSWYAIHAYNERLREQGRQEVRAEDAKALAIAKAAADAETKRLKDKADQAEHSHDKELTDLRAYQRDHPISLWVSNGKGHSIACMPRTATSNSIDASAGPSAESVLSMPERDSSERDIGPMLSALAARADEVSAQLREWQSR